MCNLNHETELDSVVWCESYFLHIKLLCTSGHASVETSSPHAADRLVCFPAYCIKYINTPGRMQSHKVSHYLTDEAGRDA